MRTSRLIVVVTAAALSLPVAALAEQESAEVPMSKSTESDDALTAFARSNPDDAPVRPSTTPEKRGYKVREIPPQQPRQASARKPLKR